MCSLVLLRLRWEKLGVPYATGARLRPVCAHVSSRRGIPAALKGPLVVCAASVSIQNKSINIYASTHARALSGERCIRVNANRLQAYVRMRT